MYSQFVVCPRRQNVVSFVKDTRDTAQQQLGIGSAHTQYVRRWWRQAGQRAPAAPPAYHSPERVPETTECIGVCVHVIDTRTHPYTTSLPCFNLFNL